MLRFEAYEDTVDRPNVVVDGSPNPGTVVCLTHWPGISVPEGTEADLSAQMAFRYLDRGADLHGGAEVVTNNHFDQDGLVAVHALVDPDHALASRGFLEDVAAAGDFATFRDRDAARVSMVVAAFADPERSPLAPLADDPDADLYHRLLAELPGLVVDVDRWRDLWAEEDEALSASLAAVADGRVTITEHPDADLAVVDLGGGERWSGHRFSHQRFDGLHPMAVNTATARLGLLVVDGRRLRFTQRYETWVKLASRRPRGRVDLRPLAEELTAAEPGGARWSADEPGALAPMLAVAGDGETALALDDVVGRLRRHLREAPVAWDPYAQS